MYRLQILGPHGNAVLQWDPQKLQEKDPATLAALLEADRFLRELLATRQQAHGMQPAHPTPRVAAYGRWLQ
ncbi:MAG TPA: hypothetical protein VNK95_09135 [Caldilineaceae bacterium]|nr:hypothetical protein [Caldilineaceae bacterium]